MYLITISLTTPILEYIRISMLIKAAVKGGADPNMAKNKDLHTVSSPAEKCWKT